VPQRIVTKTVEVTRTYLELTEPGQLAPARAEGSDLTIQRAHPCTVELCQQLYRDVGSDWHWVDRWQWRPDDWQRYVGQPGFGIWLLRRGGETAGFFELKPDSDRPDSWEIALFGLLPRFHGLGLGKHLLTCAVETAWSLGARRVWLHTCTLDSPAALPNYLARGFRPFRTERYLAEV
jgi:GNAT superfamily N-acetyltransferase